MYVYMNVCMYSYLSKQEFSAYGRYSLHPLVIERLWSFMVCMRHHPTYLPTYLPTYPRCSVR